MQIVPRRSNLSGRQRADGRWEIRVTLTRLDGAKVRKSIFGATFTECQESALKLIHETGRSQKDCCTIAELAEDWESSWELSPNTVRAYKGCLRNYIIPLFGHRKCDELKVPMIVQAIKRIDAKRTRDMVRTVLSTMLNYGRIMGFVDQHPMAGIRLARHYKPVRKRIIESELEAVLALIDADKRVFFEFLADTGLRPWKEAIDLPRESIGYRSDTYFVRVGDSKSDAGKNRPVPFTNAKIAHQLSEQPEYLFPYSRSTYERAWEAARADITDATIYSLRRLAITRWCDQGLDLDIVKSRAGHTDIRLVLEVYNEVQCERLLTGEGVKQGVKISEVVGS